MMGMPWPKTPEAAARTLSNLYAFLATTGDHRQAGEIGAAIERFWRLSGGDTVNLLIDRGEMFSSRNESEKALPFLDAAVDLAPDYAEAWSHRAYIEYRLQNYQGALGDLRRALALEPNHFPGSRCDGEDFDTHRREEGGAQSLRSALENSPQH